MPSEFSQYVEGHITEIDTESQEGQATYAALEQPGVRQHPAFLEDFRALAANAGIKTPGLLLSDSASPDGIMSLEKDGRNYVILTDGALNLLDRNELNGTLAHEIAHIKLGHCHERTLAEGKPVSNIIAAAFVFRDRRKDEVAADKASVTIAGDADGLKGALRKLQDLEKMYADYNDMFFYPPQLGDRILEVLNEHVYTDHPAIEKRIGILDRYAARHATEIAAAKHRLADIRADFARAAAPPPLPAPPSVKNTPRPPHCGL